MASLCHLCRGEIHTRNKTIKMSTCSNNCQPIHLMCLIIFETGNSPTAVKPASCSECGNKYREPEYKTVLSHKKYKYPFIILSYMYKWLNFIGFLSAIIISCTLIDVKLTQLTIIATIICAIAIITKEDHPVMIYPLPDINIYEYPVYRWVDKYIPMIKVFGWFIRYENRDNIIGVLILFGWEIHITRITALSAYYIIDIFGILCFFAMQMCVGINYIFWANIMGYIVISIYGGYLTLILLYCFVNPILKCIRKSCCIQIESISDTEIV